MDTHDPGSFNEYMDKLGAAANVSIATYDDLVIALKTRHDHFALNGCELSDHGLEEMYADEFTRRKK